MLTPQQEEFAKAIVSGMTNSDAYRSAYNTKRITDKSVWEKASRLANDVKVKARIAELREKLAKSTIKTAQERLEWLTRLVDDESNMISDRLRAVDIMNKMTGEYVQKVEAEVKQETTIIIELSDDDE